MTNVNGFIFEIYNADRTIKSYFLAAEHSADQQMLTSLETEKFQAIFKKATHFHFENVERYINDIDHISEKKGLENYSFNIIELDKNPEPFPSLFNIPQPDVDQHKILPGTDFHLLKKIYDEKGTDYKVFSLEAINASHQNEATTQTLEDFQQNLNSFVPKGEVLPEIEIQNPQENLTIAQIVKQKNDAWKVGDKEKFLEAMKQLEGNPDDQIIAFQRNRDVDLAKAVENVLLSLKDNEEDLFVFGTNHLVSTDKVNLFSLLSARGWFIKQI